MNNDRTWEIAAVVVIAAILLLLTGVRHGKRAAGVPPVLDVRKDALPEWFPPDDPNRLNIGDISFDYPINITHGGTPAQVANVTSGAPACNCGPDESVSTNAFNKAMSDAYLATLAFLAGLVEGTPQSNVFVNIIGPANDGGGLVRKPGHIVRYGLSNSSYTSYSADPNY